MSTTNIGASVLAGAQSTSSSGGLGSGIDVSELVSAALANQTAELNLLQGQQQTLSTESSALSQINTDLQNLQNAALDLTDPAGVLTDLTATSSNNSVLTASAASGATEGIYNVEVNNLATTSSYYSDAVATADTPIATGSLTIQVGSSTPTTITIDDANNTLNGLAAAINGANIGLTASVINDASGARLAILSNTSGAPGDLTVTPSSDEINFTKAVTGTNASLTVDGIPISSSTNTVTSAIPGVTLNLATASPGTPVSLTVGADTTDAANAINSFVTAYNQLVTDVDAQYAVDPTTNTAGPLIGDSTLQLVQTSVLSAIAYSTAGNGSVNSLADLGITVNDDGTLAVDNGQLTAALQNDPASVQSFFQTTNSSSFGSNLDQLLSNLADPATGAVAVDATGLQQQQTDLGQQISDFEDQINTQQQQLTQQFDQVDVTLQELPVLLSQTQSQLASLG
ncbi:MAG TPA: flagellar filament capping protein FliD [Candidatus Aquilonibacter sp.]|nr:flagellar filament capping protein FliD [Candidatus Aquilonibacter sp.]